MMHMNPPECPPTTLDKHPELVLSMSSASPSQPASGAFIQHLQRMPTKLVANGLTPEVLFLCHSKKKHFFEWVVYVTESKVINIA